MATTTETATDASEAAQGAAEASSGGLPQLDFSTYPNQLFWLVVTLAVIFLVLTKVALPRIASVLAERRGTITGDIAAAEDLKVRALEAEEIYNQALADARAAAAQIVADAKAEIQVGLDKATVKADAEISAKAAESEAAIAVIRAGALEAVKEVAKDAAKEIVAAFGGKADARSVTSAVNARMKG